MKNKIDLLLKIGGSVLTDKTKTDVINTDIITDICKILKQLYVEDIKMCIVTGVGNVGHQAVTKHSIQKGDNGSFKRRLGLLEAQIKVNEIRNIFLHALLDAEIPAVQIYTSSIATSDKMKVKTFDISSIEGFLESNLVPVVSGDIVFDSSMGYSVLSGDVAFLEISKQLLPKILVFGTNVDGIFNDDPIVNKEAILIPVINSEIMDDVIQGISTGLSQDVSGAMLGKFNAITSILGLIPNIRVHVINLKQPSNLIKVMNKEDFNHTIIEN